MSFKFSQCVHTKTLHLQLLASYMDGEVAPEFIYDQGLFYPAAGNYYGYVCTGTEPVTEWDDHNNFVSLDGQDLHLSGLRTENFPCVYYTPSYEYQQSPYNPFNPYIPGAVMGTDNPFLGTQQCLTNAPYLQPVSPPNYIPVVGQSGIDYHMIASPDPLVFNGNSAKYAPLSSLSVTTTPFKVPLENLSLEPSQSSTHQFQLPGRLSDGSVVNALPGKKSSSHGALTNGSAPPMTQRTEHVPRASITPVHNPIKDPLPSSNRFTSLRSNVPEWVPSDKTGPRTQYNGVFLNRSLGDQNRGPRINTPKVQLTSPISLKACTTKAGTGNLDDNIIVHADHYNKDNFPVDYPDAKFFVIKSYSEDDVHKSIKYNVWSSTTGGNKKLDVSYAEAQRISVGKQRKCPVFLFFSVNASGHFCGVAEMTGPVDFHKDMDFWLQDKWTGSFPVKWHIIKDVPNTSFRHIILVNNEYRPVTSSRDTQEIYYLPGISMLTIFKNTPLKTSILDDFMHYEERQRVMQEEKTTLGRKTSYETSVLTSPPNVTTNKTGSLINQPPNLNEQKPNPKPDHTPVSDPKETNSKPVRLDYNIIEQDLQAEEGKQPNVEVTSDANTSLEIDRKQKNQSKNPKSPAKLGTGEYVISRQDKRDAEANILTVGSMQINIDNTNSSFSGPLTVGSIPVDDKKH